MSRIILHCDLNSFYASVELLSHPELKDVPAAVCGDPASRHGIILAKNDPAKKYVWHPDGGNHLAGPEEMPEPAVRRRGPENTAQVWNENHWTDGGV